MFEPTHGSAPVIAGHAIADPTAMLFTAAQMLDWLGEEDPATAEAGRLLYEAVARDLAENSGQPRKTAQIGDAVCNNVAALIQSR